MKRPRLFKGDVRAIIFTLLIIALFVGYQLLKPTRVGEGATAQVPASTPSAQVAPSIATPSSTTPPATTSSPDTLPIRTDRYPGPPPRSQYVRKLPRGATICLNSADTLLLQRVPGIGPAFARRIAKYRQLLGGYYCVEQLQEVYGMDRDRYDQIAPYFIITAPAQPIYLSPDSIAPHPYLQWQHRATLQRLIEEQDTLTWHHLMAEKAFRHDDSLRLASYLPLPYIKPLPTTHQ